MAAGKVVILLKTVRENLRPRSGAVITRAPFTLTAKAEGTTGGTEQNKPLSANKPKPSKGNSFAFHVEDHTNRHHNNPTG